MAVSSAIQTMTQPYCAMAQQGTVTSEITDKLNWQNRAKGLAITMHFLFIMMHLYDHEEHKTHTAI